MPYKSIWDTASLRQNDECSLLRRLRSIFFVTFSAEILSDSVVHNNQPRKATSLIRLWQNKGQ